MTLRQLLALGLLLLFWRANAQDRQKLDSLRKVQASATHDTTRILALVEIGRAYYRSAPDTTMLIADRARILAERIKYEKGRGRALNTIGLAHWVKSNHSLALENLQEALHILRAVNDPYWEASTLNNMGLIYQDQGEFKKARDLYTKALEIFRKVGVPSSIAQTMSNAGLTYEFEGDLEKALEHYRAALHIYEEAHNQLGIAQAMTNIAYVYFSQSNDTAALRYSLKAAGIQEAINDKFTLISTYICLAQIYDRQGDLSQCVDFANRAIRLAKEMESMVDERQAVHVLYQAYKQRNDLAKALFYHENYKELSDSIFSVEKTRAIATIESKAELDVKQQELNASKEQSQLRQRINYVVTGALISMAVLLWVLFGNRTRLQVAYNKLEDANRNLTAVKDELEFKAVQLNASNDAKDKIFSVISHDLRGPMSGVKEMIKMLESGEITEQEFMQYIPALGERVNHSNEILEELLDWSRSQMGVLNINKTTFKLREFLQQETSRYGADAKNKGIVLSLLEPEATLTAFADEDMIKTVIRNLINNAIKFSRSGDEIIVSANGEGSMTRVSVSDTGVGIKPENIGRIFVGSGFTTYGTAGEKGTGVGLMLCREFIEKNGGKISVTSDPGKKTEFVFTLPSQAT